MNQIVIVFIQVLFNKIDIFPTVVTTASVHIFSAIMEFPSSIKCINIYILIFTKTLISIIMAPTLNYYLLHSKHTYFTKEAKCFRKS